MHANYVLFIYPYLNDSSRSKLLVHKRTSIGSNSRAGNQAQSQVTTVTWTRSIVHYDGVVNASVQWDVRITSTECGSSTHHQSRDLRTTHCSLGKMETTCTKTCKSLQLHSCVCTCGDALWRLKIRVGRCTQFSSVPVKFREIPPLEV